MQCVKALLFLSVVAYAVSAPDWSPNSEEPRFLRAVKNTDYSSSRSTEQAKATNIDSGKTTIEADFKGEGYLYAVKNSGKEGGGGGASSSGSDEFAEFFGTGEKTHARKVKGKESADHPKGIQDIISESSMSYGSSVQGAVPMVSYGGSPSFGSAEQPRPQDQLGEEEEEQPKFHQLIQININGQKVTKGKKFPAGDVPRPSDQIQNSYGSASPAQSPGNGYGSASPAQFPGQGGGYGSASPAQFPMQGGGYGSASPAQFPMQGGGYGSASPAQFPMQGGGYGSASPAQFPMQGGGYGSSSPAQFPMQGGYGSSSPAQFPTQGGYGSASPAQFPMQGSYSSMQPAQFPMQMQGGLYGSASPAQFPMQSYGSAQPAQSPIGSYGGGGAAAPVVQCMTCNMAPAQQSPSYGGGSSSPVASYGQASPALAMQVPSYASAYKRSKKKLGKSKFAQLFSRSWLDADDDWTPVLNPPATRSKRSLNADAPESFKLPISSGPLMDAMISRLPDYANVESELLPMERYRSLIFDFDEFGGNSIPASELYTAIQEKDAQALAASSTTTKSDTYPSVIRFETLPTPAASTTKPEAYPSVIRFEKLPSPAASLSKQEHNPSHVKLEAPGAAHLEVSASSVNLVNITNKREEQAKQQHVEPSVSVSDAKQTSPQQVPILEYKHDMSSSDYKAEFITGNGIVSKEAGFLKISTLLTKSNNAPLEDSAEPNFPLAYAKVGSVSWTSPEGVKVQLNYEADENGYRPTISKT